MLEYVTPTQIYLNVEDAESGEPHESKALHCFENGEQFFRFDGDQGAYQENEIVIVQMGAKIKFLQPSHIQFKTAAVIDKNGGGASSYGAGDPMPIDANDEITFVRQVIVKFNMST